MMIIRDGDKTRWIYGGEKKDNDDEDSRIQAHNDDSKDDQPEHIKHASLFSNEHINFASSASRSRCLCNAAANSGSASAAALVLSSSDKDAVAWSSEMALGGGEMRPLLVGGGVSVGVIGSCLMVTAAPLGRAELRTGEGDGEGVLIPTPFGLLFLSTTTAAAVAAFVFAVFASLITLWSTVN
jgi:hypothetical protein